METILSISLQLNFTPNTLGCYGLMKFGCYCWVYLRTDMRNLCRGPEVVVLLYVWMWACARIEAFLQNFDVSKTIYEKGCILAAEQWMERNLLSISGLAVTITFLQVRNWSTGITACFTVNLRLGFPSLMFPRPLNRVQEGKLHSADSHLTIFMVTKPDAACSSAASACKRKQYQTLRISSRAVARHKAR